MVSPSLDERDRPLKPLRQVALHHREELDVIVQEQGGQAEVETLASSRGWQYARY